MIRKIRGVLRNIGVPGLKLCPFCGIKPKIENTEPGTPYNRWSVTCESSKCLMYKVDTGDFQEKEKAIAAWNRRSR